MTKLNQAINQANNLLLKASLNPSLSDNLVTAFGNNYNITVANNLFSQWQNSNFSNLPTIQVLSPSAMNGAQGAYSTSNNTIYLSSSFIESKSVTAIRDVIIEEIGHFIDAQINTIDSQGDEGEIWQKLVVNNKISDNQLDTLRSENDWSTITVDGQILNVEKSVITLNVNTVFDENDGSATTGTGLSLRDAIIIANNNVNNDYIINLSSGQTYFFTIGASEDEALGGDLDIKTDANVTIRTNGDNRAIIDASTLIGSGDRVFDVLSGGNLTLEKVVVTGGRSSSGGGILNAGTLNISQSMISNNLGSSGGGIYNYNNGTLQIINSTINNNSANSGNGGGIYNISDSLFILNSTINNNSASYNGGGIFNIGVDTVIAHSTINNNLAGNDGGGIYNSDSNLIITNSTISSNSADDDGGGLFNSNSSTENTLLVNTTITQNISDANNGGSGNGGGIYNGSTGLALRNTIVADNLDNGGSTPADIVGSVQGNAYNLIGNLSGASGTVGTGSDIVLPSGQTAGLGALANNGGFTQTHALLSGSLAIDAGVIGLIGTDLGDIDGDGNTSEIIPFDQRGNGYNRVSGNTVDIGAFEFQNQFLPSLTINDRIITEGNSGTKTAVFTVTRTGTALQPITVNFATANGTATAGNDYVARSGSLSFATNETTKTISIVINGDTIVEPDETFFVNLSNATNATIVDSQGQGTITNDDLIVGDGNNNNLLGSTGNDTLQGLGGNDTLRGGAGNDILEGGTGNDSMVGGADNDTYFVEVTGDRVIENANEGTDTVNSSISYLLGNNVENLTLTGTSNLVGLGNVLSNRITGNGGTNMLYGYDGNDTLLGLGGNDNLYGGNGNDSLDSGTGNDKLIGGLGNDVLLGGDGNDTLIGGNGADTLRGGAGVDRFVFKYADEGIDRIIGFSTTEGDRIVVSASGFDGGLTANANLNSSQFVVGSSATNASQRFIYNSGNGALFFDQDGNGIIGRVQIATLNTGLNLTNNNIFVES